jgi:KaiC/GvpD/RAD55 family RecA-like ATPase
MTKKTNLIWRLGKLPTVEELQKLIIDKIITKEEAREILFKSEEIDTEEKRDKKSLESEIKFLRELIETLSKHNNNVIIDNIKLIEKHYKSYPWYQPYYYWTYPSYSNGSLTVNGNGTASNYNNVTTQALNILSDVAESFNKIKTF